MIAAFSPSVRSRPRAGLVDCTAAGRDAGAAGRNAGPGVRGGMTLVELLVTLVIISILTSLSMAGLAVARNSARKSKTEATIRKLSEIIIPYYEQYETRRPKIDDASRVAALANGRAYLTDAKQTAIRRLMALELPERVSDFRDAFTVSAADIPTSPPLALTYVEPGASATARLGEVPPAARRYFLLTSVRNADGTLQRAADGSVNYINATSSELLHLIVTRGPVADPDIIAHFREDEVRDTDGNGLPEFVDGWNRPIAFRRWPIGFNSPMQPIDGTLRNIEPLISSNGHRLVPLIFSAGLDGSYDIEAMTSLSYGALNYNPFPSSPGASAIAIAPQSPAVAGSVVLVATTLSSGSVTGPFVFTATRLGANATIPGAAFQTVGSERDTGSADGDTPNGIVESRDNITNHDMTR
jgi:prepilin-type N-terminal cleavage/methylation domain-containing protein